MTPSGTAASVVAAACACVFAFACGKKAPSGAAPDASPGTDASPAAAAPNASTAGDAGVARPGMAWIPPGVLRAGTPLDRAPRIPDEELPGTATSLGGYYVDLLAYPNEPGAIATTNVTRDEAQHLCQGKGKRLCTELEWERACKGPENTTYEYGNEYRAQTCGTGLVVELAARRPTGDRVVCKSAFGVTEMHGGVWEWTDSAWGRGSKEADLGVLRGGNAVAGELVGRCANGIGRPVAGKGPTMGFRCCAGPRNDAKVELAIVTGPPLERSAKPAELAARLVPLAEKAWKSAVPPVFDRAWTWRPLPNEELVVASGCMKEPRQIRCGLMVARPDGATAHLVAELEGGKDPLEVAQLGEARKIRARGADAQGPFVRDLVYSYGRVEVSEAKR